MAPESVQPKIAVVIAVSNGLPHIVEAVESALRQGPIVERVVVVDDRSTDDTWEAMAGIPDPRLELMKSPREGVSAARNAGAQRTDAPWLLFLDADDRLTEGAVEALAAEIRRGVSLVYGDYERIDEQGRTVGKRGWIRNLRSKPSGEIREPLLGGNFIINGGVLICEREAFLKVGGFPAQLSLCEDWHLWCQLATVGEARYLPRRVMEYRVHAQSVMMRKPREYEDFAPALQAIFSDRRIRASVPSDLLVRLRRRGESSLMVYCAQQALRARKYGIALPMAIRAFRHHPSRGPWLIGRLVGAWSVL